MSLPKLTLHSPRSNQSKNNHHNLSTSKSLTKTKRYYSPSKQLTHTSTCAYTSRDTYQPAVNYGNSTIKYPQGYHKNIPLPNFYLDYEPVLSYYPKSQNQIQFQKSYENYTNPIQSEYWSCAHKDVSGQNKRQTGQINSQKYPRGTQTPLYATQAKSTETQMEILSRNQEKYLQKMNENKERNENEKGWNKNVGKFVKWKSNQQSFQKREENEGKKELSFSHNILSNENYEKLEIGDLSKSQIQKIEPINDQNKRTFSEAILDQIMGHDDSSQQFNNSAAKYDIEKGEKEKKKYNENNKFSQIIMGKVTKTVETNQSQVIKNIHTYNKQESYVHSHNNNHQSNQNAHQNNQGFNNQQAHQYHQNQNTNHNKFSALHGHNNQTNQQATHIQYPQPTEEIQYPHPHPHQLSTVQTTSLTIPPPAPHSLQNSHSQTPASVPFQSTFHSSYLSRQSESFQNRINKISNEFNMMKLELDDTTQIHFDNIIDSKNQYIDYSYKFIQDLNKVIGDGVIQKRRPKPDLRPLNYPSSQIEAAHFGRQLQSNSRQKSHSNINYQQYHHNSNTQNTLQVPQLRVLSPPSIHHTSPSNRQQHHQQHHQYQQQQHQQAYQLPPYQINGRPSQLPYHPHPHPNLKSQTLVEFHNTSNSQSPQRPSLPHFSFNQNSHLSHNPQNVIVSVPITTKVRPPTPLPPPLPQQITKQVQFKRSGVSSSQGSKTFIPI